MSKTPLKGFQDRAKDSAVAALSSCLTDLTKLAGTPSEKEGGMLIIASKGYLLFEAPTGTGKTLMAGNTVEALSRKYKTIWFWFAPFSGVIDQTAKTIRTEFNKLRVKNPSTDRQLKQLKPGDIFVTTWASVAVSRAASRKIRTRSETMPSIDGLIQQARREGFRIGTVIDEAHHSFRKDTEAHRFYQDVLAPDVTILATATPRDNDIDSFIDKNQVKHLHRIAVSRAQGVDAGLIKKGVKVAVFKAPKVEISQLIDFRETALRYGVQTHRAVAKELGRIESTVRPLLLVQVDSDEGSVERTQSWLRKLGFVDGQVRTHTADEPDPHLIAIANDEDVEVLIFKMAIATGFDAPRAFTLVSMRTSRDPDFGVQIVGRIMRVDRRLQGAENLPESLNYGYVFLSDNEGQAGLTVAAQRINAIKDEIADLTNNVVVVTVGEQPPSAQETENGGQTKLFVQNSSSPPDNSSFTKNTTGVTTADAAATMSTPSTALTAGEQRVLEAFELVYQAAPKTSNSTTTPSVTVTKPSIYKYPLRTDLAAPTRFRRAKIALNHANILSEVVNLFRFDDNLLTVAQQSAAKILMEQTEIFAGKKERPEEINAYLADREIGKMAQRTLFEADQDGMLDVRELHQALEAALNEEFGRAGWLHLQTSEAVRSGLAKILALRPDALRKAIDEALKRHIESEDADPIPTEVVSFIELDYSRFNLYGIIPEDLNTWEVPFAKYLDDDITDTVRWWHRNPPKKPFAVCMPLPGQPNFYPDFIVGVADRQRGNGILLVEIKRVINDEEGNAHAKSKIEHPDYKKIMMVYWEKEERWMVVEFDHNANKNILDRVMRAELMKSY